VNEHVDHHERPEACQHDEAQHEPHALAVIAAVERCAAARRAHRGEIYAEAYEPAGDPEKDERGGAVHERILAQGLRESISCRDVSGATSAA
jgi:hypothetical protein